MKVHSFCQEDRLFTSGTDGVGGVDELILHYPLAMIEETGQLVFWACAGRAQGAPMHAVVRSVMTGKTRLALLLNVADLGGPNRYYLRLLRGYVIEQRKSHQKAWH